MGLAPIKRKIWRKIKDCVLEQRLLEAIRIRKIYYINKYKSLNICHERLTFTFHFFFVIGDDGIKMCGKLLEWVLTFMMVDFGDNRKK
jgi:hypothetical protein